jgi:hypothetical protein
MYLLLITLNSIFPVTINHFKYYAGVFGWYFGNGPTPLKSILIFWLKISNKVINALTTILNQIELKNIGLNSVD